MKYLILFLLSTILFCGVTAAQEYEAPKNFALVTYDVPDSFTLTSDAPPVPKVNESAPKVVRVVPPQDQTQGQPPKIEPQQIQQPTCHFSLKSQKWYFRGSDLAGHVMGTHGHTVRNIFGYTNDQVRRMTRDQLVILHSNAHEWERGVRWNRG